MNHKTLILSLLVGAFPNLRSYPAESQPPQTRPPVAVSREADTENWRDIETREKLEQVGLSDSAIRALQREQFAPNEVERRIRQSLLDRGV